MNPTVQLSETLVAPVATLLGTMLIVMLGVYLQNRGNERLGEKLSAQIDTLRAEFKQLLVELELGLTKQILDLAHRIEGVEGARALIRTP